MRKRLPPLVGRLWRGVLIPFLILLLPVDLAACRKGSDDSLVTMSEIDYRDHLKRGVWLCLLAGNKCSACKKGRRILREVADEFEGKVKFCVLKDGWKYFNKRRGQLILFPDQGENRFVDYKDELSSTPIRHFLWYFLAEKVSLVGDQETALLYLQQAASLKPSEAEVHFKIGYIFHTHKHDLVKAVDHYERAMGSGGRVESVWNLKYMAGNAYLTLGYLDRARRMYEEAIQVNPSSLSPYKEASIAARLAGNFSLSSSYLRKCLELQPGDADALSKMAEILVGEAMEIEQEEARLLGNSRLPVWIRRERPGNSSSMEKLQEAETLLVQSVSNSPQLSESRFLLGTVLKMLGRREQAQAQFRKSVALRDQGQGRAESPPEAKKKRRIKIFVYDIHPQFNSAMLSLNMQQCRNSIYAAEVYIHEQLLISSSLTLDPEAADLFFIPLYAACFLSSHFVRPGPGWPDNDVDIGKTYGAVQQVLQHIRQTYPFFDRSAGADHVLVLSSDWGSCQGPFLELHNSILLLTSGDRTLVRPAWYAARAADHMGSSQEFAARAKLPCFQLFKDVAIPPLVPHPTLTGSYIGERTRGRDILVYFRGTAAGSVKAMPYNKHYSLGVRQLLLRRFSGVKGWLVSDRINSSSYHEELLRSVFCLTPAGWELWSVRFFEAVLTGCIPVLLADDIQLPFQHRLDYSKFTVKVEQRRIVELDHILSSINQTVIRQKQEALGEVWKRFTYQRPPQEGDAFSSIMEELARRVEMLGKTPAGGWS